MKRLLEFPLESGGSILVEADLPTDERLIPAGLPGSAIVKVAETFEATLNRLKPMVDAIVASLRTPLESPDKIGVEFGIKLGAKAGMVLTSADTEANLKISLEWNKKNVPTVSQTPPPK